MWGTMTDQLRGRKEVSKPLLDVLDNIRINFRNPTTHPKKVYDLNEVQDLFNLCCDSINRIVKNINK